MTDAHPISESVPETVLAPTGSSGYKRRYHAPSGDGETPQCVDDGTTTIVHDTTYVGRPKEHMIGTYRGCTRCFPELADETERDYSTKEPCPKCGKKYKTCGMANHMRDCLATVEVFE